MPVPSLRVCLLPLLSPLWGYPQSYARAVYPPPLWCRRCEVLKKEISERLDAPFRWLLVDVEQIHELVERFSVVTMPRLDVYCGGKTTSVESFDAKIENIVRMIEDAQKTRPILQLDDDF